MAKQHASLSPSSAHRWIPCPGSLRVIDEAFPDGVPYEPSIYAEEGTKAHDVAEYVAAQKLGLPYPEKLTVEFADATQREDMFKYAEVYAEYLEEIFANSDPDGPAPVAMLENRVHTGIDGVWGTADAILVVDGEIHVVDFKYGIGVQVATDENEQLMLYALGALRYIEDIFGDALGPLEKVHMTIVQPRTDIPLSETTVSRQYLERWGATTATQSASLANQRLGPVVPSDKACRWCPAAGVCTVRAEKVVTEDFGRASETLSPDELGHYLGRIPEIEKWCRDVADYAMQLLYDRGEDIPGYKTVWKRGSRHIADTEGALEVLTAAGFDMESVSRTQLETLSKLDRLVGGKEQLAEILGPIMGEREGKPAIVSSDDKRPAVTKFDSAQEEFSKE